MKNDVLFLFWKETYKVLSFNIVYFLTWNKCLPLISAPYNKRRTSQFQNIISAGGAY